MLDHIRQYCIILKIINSNLFISLSIQALTPMEIAQLKEALPVVSVRSQKSLQTLNRKPANSMYAGLTAASSQQQKSLAEKGVLSF